MSDEASPIDPLGVRLDHIRARVAIDNAVLHRLALVVDICAEVGAAADGILFEAVMAQRERLLAMLPSVKQLRRQTVDAVMRGETGTPR